MTFINKNTKVKGKSLLWAWILLVFTFGVPDLQAQSRGIAFSTKQMSLRQAFSEIEKQTDMTIAYNDVVVDVNKVVSTDISGKALGETLAFILRDTDATYRLRGMQIIIVPAPKKQPAANYTGTILDSKGEPLQGALVVVKGTTRGVTTNAAGKFSIQCEQGSVLVVSFLGYQPKEILLGVKTTIDVELEEQTHTVDDVIVVGYGRESKRFVTGAIANANLEANSVTANLNIGQALRGTVAGVQFTDSGRPGEGGTILVRGTRSISAGNAPLLIVDGITFNGSLNDINPNDVKEMQVLKDASSAAIYGSRAANGVILIETHRGGESKPTVKFDLTAGFMDWSYTPELLSPTQYLQKTLDYRYQNGQDAYPEDIEYYLSDSEKANYLRGKTINPYKEVSQTGYVQNYSVSVSGSTPSTSYFISGMYSQENGLVYNDNANRIAMRANLETKVTDWFSLGVNSQFARRTKNGIVPDMSQVHFMSPFAQLYIDDDKSNPKLYPVDDSLVSNPMFVTLTRDAENLYNNLFSNIFAVVDAPFLPGLTYRLNYSPSFRWNHTFSMNPIYTEQGKNDKGAGSKSHSEYFDWVLENILDYSHTFNKKHYVGVTLMYGASSFNRNATTANSSDYFNDALGWNSLQIGETQTVSSSASTRNEVSMMARLNYRFKDRYMLTGTVRRDGSSVFGPGNKYSTFPSAAFAWMASEESFMKGIKWLGMLKLRLSYGQIGNQAIEPYGTLSKSETTKYVFGDGGKSVIGIYPSAMGNPDLKWETTTSANVAVDFQLFKNRLSGTVEYYDTKTHDLLLQKSLPNMTGFGQIWTNLGQTSNKGVEVTLNSLNISSGKFSWRTGGTFTYNKNRIDKLYGLDANNDGKEDDDIANKWFIGQPVHVEYDYVFDGIYQVGDPMPAGYSPGFVRVKTASDDPTKSAVATDKRVIGQKEPKFRWGMSNTFTYGDWSLYVFVNATHGWTSIFNRILPYNPGKPINMLDVGYWTEQNKSNTRPSLTYNNPLNHRFYLNRDFIRIQDVSLSYTFNRKLMQKWGMAGLKVYASAKNLYTWTDWLGFDPETGAEPGGFPVPRTFILGLNFSF